jgi:hypothetical protein
MQSVSSSGIALSLFVITAAITSAGRVEAATQPQPPTAVEWQPRNSVELQAEPSGDTIFRAFGSESPVMRQMAERLRDPQQREVLRAEQRAQIVSSHEGLMQALENFDAQTEEKLIDLLTDQQMQTLDEFHLRRDGAGSAQADPWEHRLRARAENETQRIEALRDLLGPENYERLQAFKATSSERAQIGMLDARLSPDHKLRDDQKEQLIAVYKEHNARNRDVHRRTMSLHSPFGEAVRKPLSKEELQRISQLQSIAANEDNLRRLPESDRLLRQGAAGILTAPQLATLEKMQAEQASNQKKWIERARLQAGLSADSPEQTADAPAERTPLAGQVKLSIKVKVNRNEPTTFTHMGNNGEPVTFASAEGLIVEATPTVYDDDVFDLQLAYYEEGSTGKRLIGNMGQMGTVSRAPAAPPNLDRHGGSGTVLIGSKGYAVELNALVEAI